MDGLPEVDRARVACRRGVSAAAARAAPQRPAPGRHDLPDDVVHALDALRLARHRQQVLVDALGRARITRRQRVLRFICVHDVCKVLFFVPRPIYTIFVP